MQRAITKLYWHREKKKNQRALDLCNTQKQKNDSR